MVKLKLETKKLEIVCAYRQACRSIYVVKVEMFCSINLHDGKMKARENKNSSNNKKGIETTQQLHLLLHTNVCTD